jgi:hypothetical protein
MIKAMLFALLFIVLGMVIFAFIAPILSRGANMRRSEPQLFHSFS